MCPGANDAPSRASRPNDSSPKCTSASARSARPWRSSSCLRPRRHETTAAWSAHPRLFNKRWAHRLSAKPALWYLTTPWRFVQQESWQKQEQLPRPRCPVICTCSVSLYECEPHGCPTLTRRGTLHDASSGELGLQIDPVHSCESCPAPNCNVTGVAASSSTSPLSGDWSKLSVSESPVTRLAREGTVSPST